MIKYLLAFLLLAFLLLPSIAFAEAYVIVDKTSREIYTMSEKNDTIPQTDQELIVLPGDFESYDLANHPSDYKYTNKFILNVAKINKKEDDKKKAQDKKTEDEKINKEMRKIAIESLKSKGENITATE